MPAKLFREREAPQRKDVAEAVDQLARLAQAQPDLAQAATLQATLLRAIYHDPARVGVVRLTPEQARASLEAGEPLLRRAGLALDPGNLRDTLLRLCDAIGGRRAPSGPDALARAVRSNRLDPWALALELVAGHAEQAAAQFNAAGVQPDAALTLLRLALLPFLELLAAQIEPLRAGVAWDHGYCPCCGTWPILAEQRGLEQLRYLRCGLCASAWALDRVRCALCGTHDHTQLGYLQVDDEEQRQRVATCDSCHHYLKIRSTLGPLSTPQLLVAEIELLHLDIIALDKGYTQPT